MKIEKAELTREEVDAMIKAFLYLKFSCEDTDSLLYASSPLINSVIDKLCAMYGHGQDWDRVFSSLSKNNKEFALNKIKRSEEDDGDLLNDEIRGVVLRECVYPYKIN